MEILKQQMSDMQYEYLRKLRSSHAAWRLLAADQAAWITAFLYQEFIAAKRRAISEEQLLGDLEDFLYGLHRENPEEALFRTPKEYLEIWADAQHMWLRRFYGQNDEIQYDLTSAAQKAIDWLVSLKKQNFVGTESRLRTVFDLLHEIVRETDSNAENRLSYLETEREKIDAEIRQIQATGKVVPKLSPLQLKERFLQASVTAEGILADFREVEENFRTLEQHLLESIVRWKAGKGELLTAIFADQDAIRSSEQGQSFAAFWRYLMLSQQQDDFSATLQKLSQNKTIQFLEKDSSLWHIDRDWVRAASEVQATIAQLSKQLRRYVDENYLLEERHIYQLICHIEEKALKTREACPTGEFMSIPMPTAQIHLPMDRPLFVPPKRTRLENHQLESGTAKESIEALFNQVSVDKVQLRRNIHQFLQHRSEVTLAEVLEKYPLRQGMTELLMYLVLASREKESFLDEEWQELLLQRPDGKKIWAKCEKVVFRRKEKRGL